jgi:hypothetical protein
MVDLIGEYLINQIFEIRGEIEIMICGRCWDVSFVVPVEPVFFFERKYGEGSGEKLNLILNNNIHMIFRQY